MKNYCIDCKKEINKKATRCRTCAGKIHSNKMQNKNNSNYIDGRSLNKHYCIECKINEICYSNFMYGNKRCYSCAKKGELSSTFKTGEYIKQHYCIESNCKNEISLTNFLYGNKRCASCAHKLENNGNWKGGLDKLPYALNWTEQLKESIRKRDNYECQNPDCNMTEEEHLITYDESLPIHHIDYNKQNCEKDNLITTCKQCNSRANFNRSYWQKIYQGKILELLMKREIK